MKDPAKTDVLVVGGGNAGLCAAIEARRAGARVVLLECAPETLRGGNSRHTRNLRYLHDVPNRFLTGPYREDEFWDDLQQVTGGETNERLSRLLIRGSADLGDWMIENGARFQPSLKGTLHLSRTNAFFLGGGKALINAYYATARRLGVHFEYDSEATRLHLDDGRFVSLEVESNGRSRVERAESLVLACGGFEANIPWLREYWGDATDGFVIRGTPYNRGLMLRQLLDAGARSVGSPREFHAIAVDARAPKFDGGIVTRLDSVPFGIVVNRAARRFYDEGEDLWPRRYAIWGGLIARQADQIAFSILDSKAVGLFMPSLFPPLEADSIAGLAAALDLDPAALESTVAEFNGATRPGSFDPSCLDDCRTEGLTPSKSHWALPLDSPPFLAFPLRPGITFTYLGVGIDERTRVIMEDGAPAANVFAAGEIMAGNILGRGYLAGLGMTIGTVFGRLAGKEAARNALR